MRFIVTLTALLFAGSALAQGGFVHGGGSTAGGVGSAGAGVDADDLNAVAGSLGTDEAAEGVVDEPDVTGVDIVDDPTAAGPDETVTLPLPGALDGGADLDVAPIVVDGDRPVVVLPAEEADDAGLATEDELGEAPDEFVGGVGGSVEPETIEPGE